MGSTIEAHPHRALLICNRCQIIISLPRRGHQGTERLRSLSEPRSVSDQSDPESKAWEAVLNFVPDIYLVSAMC